MVSFLFYFTKIQGKMMKKLKEKDYTLWKPTVNNGSQSRVARDREGATKGKGQERVQFCRGLWRARTPGGLVGIHLSSKSGYKEATTGLGKRVRVHVVCLSVCVSVSAVGEVAK